MESAVCLDDQRLVQHCRIPSSFKFIVASIDTRRADSYIPVLLREIGLLVHQDHTSLSMRTPISAQVLSKRALLSRKNGFDQGLPPLACIRTSPAIPAGTDRHRV